jgi:tRNA A-37 threonylcarbamoyl transferase component Bud32/membrane-associated phospholipid phosphatase
MASTSRTVGRPSDQSRTPTVVTRRVHRRPSGEPPPLPRRLSASGKWWLALAVLGLGLVALLASVRRFGLTGEVVDHKILTTLADVRASGLTTVMKGLGVLATGWALKIIWLANMLVLAYFRRWRHLVIWLVAGLIVDNLAQMLAQIIQRPRPFGVQILGPWHGFAMPSLPMAVLAAFSVSTLYALVPAGRWRKNGKIVVAVILFMTLLSRLYLAQETLTDALLGILIGVTIPLCAFRLFAPNEVFPVTYKRGRTAHLDVSGARHDAIVRGLEDQLGVIPIEVKPFGLEGSGGSTPLRVKLKGDPDTYIFCKLYAATHVRSDRWYKLGRTLMYGRLEDEKPFNTVRRLVQYEDYILRLMHSAGLPVPKPYGIIEITPEREYLLVSQFFDGAQEIGDVAVDEEIIDQGLQVVRRMWDAGLAHRDIKPANLLVREGQLQVIDSAFGEVRPSPWRQAVDLGNMMLVLALRSDAVRVYDRAREFFTDDEIAEAFAATRGLTMPSQLRRLMRAQGRDVHAEFLQLLPFQLPPVKIQRWSFRRVGLMICTLLVVILALTLAIPLLIGSPL